MAMTIQEATIFSAGSSVAAGGTEASPVASGIGTVVGPFADYADTFAYRITNGSSAPGVALTLVLYGVVGGRMYEVFRDSGDTVANSSFSNSFACPAGYAYFTARAFGNTVQPVTVEVYLERQVP